MRSHLRWCGAESVGAAFKSLKSSSLPLSASSASAGAATPEAVAGSVDVASANLGLSSLKLSAAGPAHPFIAGRHSQRALWILDFSTTATRLMFRSPLAAGPRRSLVEPPLPCPPQRRARRAVLWGYRPHRMRPFHVRPHAVSMELQGVAVRPFDWAVVRALWVYADASSALPAIDRLWDCAHPARAPAPRASFIMIAGALLTACLIAPAARRDATPAEPPGALIALASRGLLLTQEAGELLRKPPS